HLSPPRIGDNAPVAQRARAEFQPSLKPPDYLAFGDPLCSLSRDLFIAELRDPVSGIRKIFTVQSLPDLIVSELRPPICVVHFEGPRAPKKWMFDVERRPDGHPGVPRSGGDIAFLEGGPVEDLAFADAIERHAARHTQFLHAVDAM